MTLFFTKGEIVALAIVPAAGAWGRMAAISAGRSESRIENRATAPKREITPKLKQVRPRTGYAVMALTAWNKPERITAPITDLRCSKGLMPVTAGCPMAMKDYPSTNARIRAKYNVPRQPSPACLRFCWR